MNAGIWTQRIVLGSAALALAWLTAVPLYFLISETFFADGDFSVGAFERAFSGEGASQLLLNSFTFAVGATIVAVATGTVLAYVYVRTDAPLKRLSVVASLVPIIVPGVLNATVWIFVASPRTGLLEAPLNFFNLDGVLDIFSMSGMVFVQGTHLSPVVFLLMMAVFRSMDPAFEEAALMSGSGILRTLRRVTLPLSLPAILGVTLIILVQSLETFEVPAVLGTRERIFVFTNRIYFLNRQVPPDLPAIGAISITVIAFAAIGIGVSNRMGGAGRERETITGKAFRPRPVELSRWGRRFCVGFVLAYFCIVVVLPFLALLYASMLTYFRSPSRVAWADFTLQNYREVVGDDANLNAWKNTTILALGAAFLVTLLTALAAWVAVRSNVRGRRMLEQLAQVPLAVPGLILGLAVAFVYLRLPGGVYGSLGILLIAYVTRFLPYGMRYSVSSMMQVGRDLEESAALSGASWGYTMRRVVLPLVGPGLLSAFVFVLVVSYRELSASLLLYSPGNEVLAVRMFQMLEDGLLTQLAALGVLLVIFLTTIVLLAFRLGSRFGVAAE